jgi:membrane protease YdiL (CAAX protease family)
MQIPPRPDAFGEPDRLPPLAPLPTWRAWEAVAVFFAALLVAAIVDSIVQAAVTSCPGRYLGQLVAGEAGLAVAVIGWLRIVDHAPLAALGLPRRPWGDLAAGVATGAVLVVAGDGVLVIVRSIVTQVLGHAPAQPDQVFTCVRGGWLIAVAPAVIVAAPFGEELFFRGYLYKGLRRRFPVWVAALISAAAFGAGHFAGLSYLLLIPGLIVVGVGLALVYERRQSLLASMAAHATFNVVGFIAIVVSRR